MPTDHPDGMRSIVISRADIQTPMDIQRQTINVKTNFKEQEVGVESKPSWEAKEGRWKVWKVIGSGVAFGAEASHEYVIATGKTAYITHVSGSCSAKNAADADKAQICRGMIKIGVIDVGYYGGDGGFACTFGTPLKILAGESLWLYAQGRANHDCDIWFSVAGYEV